MINDIYFENFPRLETSRMILRQLILDDAERIRYLRSHPQVMRFMDSHEHKEIKDSELFIADNLESYRLQNGIFWALSLKDSGKFIGDLALWKLDRKNSRGEIGYTLDPAFWGKGLMKEALITVLDFGFRKLKLHSFEANINPKNEKSKRLLIQLGFVKEAYFRENYYFNGKYLDSEIYSLLEKDFQCYKN